MIIKPDDSEPRGVYMFSWERVECDISTFYTVPVDRTIQELFATIRLLGNLLCGMDTVTTPYKKFLYIEKTLIDAHTQYRIDVPMINSIRGRGWFRNFSELMLFKFHIVHKILSFRKKEMLIMEFYLDNKPNIARVHFCNRWISKYDPTQKDLYVVNLHFRIDQEYGFKLRLLEVEEIEDAEKHLLKFNV